MLHQPGRSHQKVSAYALQEMFQGAGIPNRLQKDELNGVAPSHERSKFPKDRALSNTLKVMREVWVSSRYNISLGRGPRDRVRTEGS